MIRRDFFKAMAAGVAGWFWPQTPESQQELYLFGNPEPIYWTYEEICDYLAAKVNKDNEFVACGCDGCCINDFCWEHTNQFGKEPTKEVLAKYWDLSFAGMLDSGPGDSDPEIIIQGRQLINATT